MCGIAGFVTPPGVTADREVLLRMVQSLSHRGPDGSGAELPSPRVALGHRRLSIIDLALGAQPMASPDGKVWITFNGEIFNYQQLRAELGRGGRVFRTQSDTEAILALYEAHGEQGLSRLRGQYALVIWDGRRGSGRLVCARDPLGIKPFHYCHEGGWFVFGSEPRALLLHPHVDHAVDPYALHLYLRYRFIPSPRSAWRAIHKLRPGELLVLEDGALRTQRFWQLPAQDCESVDDVDRARVDLRKALQRAVERQKVADVEVGAFLSGGIDSSTVATLLARTSSQPIATYTVGFAEKSHDEREFAALVAGRIGSRHIAEEMGSALAEDVLPKILDHLDEPFGDPSLVPTWLLCAMTSRHGKVALSGDGGDELFGGYGRTYRALGVLAWPRLLRPWQRVLGKIRRPGEDPSQWRGDDPRVDAEYVRLLEDVDAADARRLYGPRLSAFAESADRELDPLWQAVRRHAALPPFSRVLAADLEAHLADYHLAKVDRAAMAHGLEVRVPFLDEDLVALAFTWTARVRLSGGRAKGLLKDAMGEDLPAAILDRPKRGFGPPLSEWFKEGLAGFARRELLDGALAGGGWLRREELDAMTREGQRKFQGSRLWRLIVLERFLRR
jgi:asparagine synthase (glutamine-hydrolysing)